MTLSDERVQEIAPDVWETAKATYYAVLDAEPVTGHSLEIIARAIMAERAANTTLRKQIADAVEALEPFARVAEHILAEAPPEATVYSLFVDSQGQRHNVTLDEYRKAVAVLASIKGA